MTNSQSKIISNLYALATFTTKLANIQKKIWECEELEAEKKRLVKEISEIYESLNDQEYCEL